MLFLALRLTEAYQLTHQEGKVNLRLKIVHTWQECVSRSGENDPFWSVEIYPPSASTVEPLPSFLLSTSSALPIRPARLFSFNR